jgi:hypothetical protein
MAKRWFPFIALSFVVTLGFAKDKNKATLPPYVLHAQTVAVIVDPEAQFTVDDPHANVMAQRDVEAALLKWGRFQPISDAKAADLLVVVRKGNERMIDDTSPDSRQNNGGVLGPGDAGNPGDPNNHGSIGSPHGAQQNLPSEGPGQQMDRQRGFGYTQDFFAVFKGGDNPRTAAPLWKYFGQDGLNPAGVPAVTAFRKAVASAEKTAAEKP